MNFDQLKFAWRAAIVAVPDAPILDRVTDEIRSGARRYRREALLRRIYGSTVFLLALAMLGIVIALPGVWAGMRVAITLWSATLWVCLVGLWRIRKRRPPHPDAPVTAHLQASLNDVRREIAYFHALRWTFWLPFGIGFVFAMAWRAPNAGGVSLFLILGTAVLWIWGFVYGPRHLPADLEPRAAQLERMLHETRSDTETTGDRS